jgi:hypothetical protein
MKIYMRFHSHVEGNSLNVCRWVTLQKKAVNLKGTPTLNCLCTSYKAFCKLCCVCVCVRVCVCVCVCVRVCVCVCVCVSRIN